jgi:citrate synthase
MGWITATDALALLGVRPQTLYANVSRGRIRAKRDPDDPRRSLYHDDDVRRLSARRAGRPAAAVVAAEAIDWGMPVLASAISTVAQGRLWYRGRDAVLLAETATLEEVAALLWEVGDARFDAHGDPPPRGSDRHPPLAAALLTLSRRIGGDIPSLGRSRAVLAVEAARLLAEVSDAMIVGGPSSALLHDRLASGWGVAAAADCLRRALVLLADHELNASTFAARVAASTGASLSACLIAGLSTLAGPLHGGASAGMGLLADAACRSGAEDAVRHWLAQGQPLPAFGHPLYPSGDPRAAALLACFEATPVFAALRGAIEAMTGELPNIDFALAALADRYGLPPDAGFVIFALARSVGWIAHALEQSATGHLIRPRARYVGPPISA